jgi:molybdopterin molybdotransferase
MHATENVCERPGLLDPAEALAVALSFVRPIDGAEDVQLSNAIGRITAETMRSAVPLPPFDQSAVDGYAIHEGDLAGMKGRSLRLSGRVVAGATSVQAIKTGLTVKLLTGAPIPAGTGAVVMEEKVRMNGADIGFASDAEPGMNIRRRGEDVGEDSIIVQSATVIDARHVAILAAAGIDRLAVRKRVRVAVMSTGNELAPPGVLLEGHQLHDANGPMLMGLLAAPGARVENIGRHGDDRLRLARTFALASSSFDLIVCSGGVSGSDADHVVPAIRDAGGECVSMSLALKPGKPLAAGRLGTATILALPGNPAAAMVGALLFARPILEALAGLQPSKSAATAARTDSVFFHRTGRVEFVPAAVTASNPDGVPRIQKLGRGGSARLLPLILADGLARIPADVGDLPAGAWIEFYPFKSRFGL